MILLLLSSGSLSSQEVTGKNSVLQKGSVSVMCTPDLFNLTSQWANQYSNLNPEVKIKVVSTDYNNAELGKSENLSIISDKSVAALSDEKNWRMVVGHDIVVPVINASNPFMKDIMQKGVSQELFITIFENPAKRTCSTLLAGNQALPITIYMVNDESVKVGLARFLKESQLQFAGIKVGSRDEVVSALQKDPYAIGFCKAVSVQGIDNQNLVENVKFLPIDKNGNGTLDYMEDIYTDMNTFQRGVWIGKYPKALCRDIYAVSAVQPANENDLAFIKWVITDGQQFIAASGYSDLVSSESQSQLDKINIALVSVPPVRNANSLQIILLILLGIVVLSLIINAAVRRYKFRTTASTGNIAGDITGFDENLVLVPDGLYYDKTHTWAFMEKDGTVTLGIDDFLQHITGPITRIEMKNNGQKIKKGDLLFSIIQSGKQLSLYAPVSGIIKKQNEALITNSNILNSSPYTDGWVYMIEPTNWYKEIQLLDVAGKYKNWLDTEFSRVKDFLAITLKPTSLEYSHVVLQDGGLLKEGILSDFGPEIWEDFQTNFLDTFK